MTHNRRKSGNVRSKARVWILGILTLTFLAEIAAMGLFIVNLLQPDNSNCTVALRNGQILFEPPKAQMGDVLLQIAARTGHYIEQDSAHYFNVSCSEGKPFVAMGVANQVCAPTSVSWNQDGSYSCTEFGQLVHAKGTATWPLGKPFSEVTGTLLAAVSGLSLLPVVVIKLRHPDWIEFPYRRKWRR